ncbi:DNA-repair protein [Psychromonas marina]|uniref:DNA-repair protein n=1 Tax=Psychromonas marina TaxID=88364 RepID=A0ABQ6DXN3_9GAMM|nr:DEAD/DEAH box helicase family protein [Psychromonas marina]GLS89931.1 DNA-repair protein [Psychromonas marina]
MTFKNLSIPLNLTTGYQNPNDDFFSPVLSCAKTFDVGVGYFSSNWLADVKNGIHQFALNEGRSRWIISPNLNVKDAEAMNKGFEIKSIDQMQNELESFVLDELALMDIDSRTLLSNLIVAGVLDFKISYPLSGGNNLFHAKMGIATDVENNQIAFNGSFNLTGNAKSNWEYIDVYVDETTREQQRIISIQDRFNTLWIGEDAFYQVFTPSKKLLAGIDSFSDAKKKNYPKKNEGTHINLRPYQQKAMQNWSENKGHGMYVMATGSGKTITALATVQKLKNKFIKQKQPLFIVFVLPLKHLLDQWHDEAAEFGFEATKCYEKSLNWRETLSEKLSHQSIHKSGIVKAMVTNATLASENFQRLLRGVKVPIMIVADEAHNLGSPTYLDALPKNAEYRLGLTATPFRHNDEEGTEALFDYFGDAVFEFSLEDAINAGYLVKYRYYPSVCEFNYDEYQDYKAITKKLENDEQSKLEAENEMDLLLGGASNKLIILRNQLEELQKNNQLQHTLIYCGSHTDDEGSRQIEKVLSMLGQELGIKTRKFTATESLEERKNILDKFARCELDAIVAIKCLDEGVDVPATKQAFVISSTSNPREFIQRRGRVLRRSPGKEEAVIYDFIVVPPNGEDANPALIEKEVRRGLEYNYLAENRKENETLLLNLADMHGVQLQ